MLQATILLLYNGELLSYTSKYSIPNHNHLSYGWSARGIKTPKLGRRLLSLAFALFKPIAFAALQPLKKTWVEFVKENLCMIITEFVHIILIKYLSHHNETTPHRLKSRYLPNEHGKTASKISCTAQRH